MWTEHWMNGMWVFPFIMIIVMLFVVFMIFGRGGFRPPWSNNDNYYSNKPKETPLDVLKKRYANGEISKEEFDKIKNDIIMNAESCDINDKGNSCCSSKPEVKEVNLKEHWNKVFTNSPDEKLGWYETDLTPTLGLISTTGLNKNARVLNVGAGSTTLIDELLTKGYSNLIATDLSEVALKRLADRVGEVNVECITDDLTNPSNLKNIAPVDLWVDRAVLHFFTEKNEQDIYFDLLKNKVKSNGFVLLAEYNLNGATVCAGLPIHRYSKEMLIEKLGSDFELIDNFDHTYLMPSGAERPYIYALFQKK
ncbi:SHOCT domain-containing protein [Galbibacter sp. PAP.153]|uniref:SHOCT domain-containing protein n=1 Tax=Galbibacter sp. PAP.153 TaxID=3104623 RepID=UPI00300B30C8